MGLFRRTKYSPPEREAALVIARQAVRALVRTGARAKRRVQVTEVFGEHPLGRQGGHITPIVPIRRITIQLAIAIPTTCIQ